MSEKPKIQTSLLSNFEKAGSGIKRMKRLAKEDNVKVEFKTGMFFEVIFYRKTRHKSEGERLRWILKQLNKNGKIKAREIENEFKVHRDTAIEDLKSLIKQNKIVRKGGGNNVWYELKSKNEENGN